MAGCCGLHHPECVVGRHESEWQELEAGKIATIPIAKGKTGACISVSFVATIGNIQIKNSRQYFVVENQFDTVDYGNGKKDKLLDVMEGRLVANSF